MTASRLNRSLVTAVAVVVLLGACAGGSSSPSAIEDVTPSPAPSSAEASPTAAEAAPSPTDAGSPAASGPQPLRSGMLPAGQYRTTAFEPTLTFTLSDWWSEYFPHDSDEIALGGPGADINMTRPAQVVDADQSVIDAPEDLVGWLTSHPGLTVGQQQAVEVAGIEATALDIEAPAAFAVPIFAYPGGNMRIPEGARVRIIVVPLDGPDLVLVIGPTSGTLEDAIGTTQPIVDSLTIEP